MGMVCYLTGEILLPSWKTKTLQLASKKGPVHLFSRPMEGVAERSWIVPEKHQDVGQFCEATINCPQAVFEADHAGEGVVLAKFLLPSPLLPNLHLFLLQDAGIAP